MIWKHTDRENEDTRVLKLFGQRRSGTEVPLTTDNHIASIYFAYRFYFYLNRRILGRWEHMSPPLTNSSTMYKFELSLKLLRFNLDFKIVCYYRYTLKEYCILTMKGNLIKITVINSNITCILVYILVYYLLPDIKNRKNSHDTCRQKRTHRQPSIFCEKGNGYLCIISTPRF